MNVKKSENNYKIFVVCGSVRPGSLTKIAMEHLISCLAERNATVDVFHPAKMPQTYLGAPFAAGVSTDLQERILKADGVIFCTPEYNGCFSAVTMAILENLGYPSVLKDRPVSMLGVATGSIGAVKALEHLRGVCSHMGALVLPLGISIAEVHQHFDERKNCINEKTGRLIKSLADDMITYLGRNR